MARTKISEFSATAGSNTDIDSINLAEGCAPSGINDAIRELMSQLKDFQTGAVGDSFNGPVGSTTAGTGAFTTLAASSTTTLSGLTASTALALDASKNVVSVTNTGTGSNVLATSPTFVTPVLGTPASGTVTNLTGTASININGTVGATTANTGAFTTVTGTTGTFTADATDDGVTPIITVANTSLNGYGILKLQGNARGGIVEFYNGATAQAAIDGQGGAVGIYAGSNASGAKVANFTSTGLNSTVIGATTPAAGSFTTGSFTKAAAGDVLTWGAGSSKTGYFYSDANALIIGGAANAAASIGTVRFDSTGLILYGPDQSKSATVTNSGLAVTGALSSTLDASIYGVSVGRGTGSFASNTILGSAALASNVSGTGLVATGQYALLGNTSGSNNTAIGYFAGYGTGSTPNETGSNNTFIGYQAEGTSTSVSNQVTIGNALVNNNRLRGIITLLSPSSGGTGTGITFPATQNASADANTLDDYEEGDWPPTQGAGLTVVGTFSASGKYTKIGKVVTVTAKLSSTTTITSTSGEICGGLPFPADYTPLDYFVGGATNGSHDVSSSCITYSTSIYGTTSIAATNTLYLTVTYFV